MKQVWITDRLPTPEDAVSDEVIIPDDGGHDGWNWVTFNLVGKGEPWARPFTMPPYVPEKTPEEIREERIALAHRIIPDDYVLLGMHGDFNLMPDGKSWPAVAFWLEDYDYTGIWEHSIHDGSFGNVLYAARKGSKIATLQEQKYWSKPSHFPPVCWIYRKGWTGPSLVRSFGFGFGSFVCGTSYTVDFGRVPKGEFRWSDRPFDNWEDGKECLVENSDE